MSCVLRLLPSSFNPAWWCLKDESKIVVFKIITSKGYHTRVVQHHANMLWGEPCVLHVSHVLVHVHAQCHGV